MSSRGDTREQPSIPEPAHLEVEHASLAVTVVALTIALGGLVVESTFHHDMLRGAYSILAALIVVGIVGFLVKLVLRKLDSMMSVLVEVRQLLRQIQGHEGPVAPEAEAALHRIGIKLLQGGREIV